MINFVRALIGSNYQEGFIIFLSNVFSIVLFFSFAPQCQSHSWREASLRKIGPFVSFPNECLRKTSGMKYGEDDTEIQFRSTQEKAHDESAYPAEKEIILEFGFERIC
ncbi:hypothetical protein CEXT_316881 [Caerostris extrusa]|uniref:Uncharacterized protein n=1 Tax=Caerostris extrusa TaxID=172846 RepID=A0AAV4UPD5_CAEEX|nr:hypothetical protein CEXT_316881 [Caerostris extrusa]